jgi:hypothetical protein
MLRAIAFIFSFWVVAGSAVAACGFKNFTDNGNGTVTNPETGLIWKKCQEGRESAQGCVRKIKINDSLIENDSLGIFGWEMALYQARSSRFLGKSDWRLPSVAELEQLFDGCDYINKTFSSSDSYPGIRYSEDGSPTLSFSYETCKNKEGQVGLMYVIPGDKWLPQERRFEPGPAKTKCNRPSPSYRGTPGFIFLVRSDIPSPEFEKAYQAALPLIEAKREAVAQQKAQKEIQAKRENAERTRYAAEQQRAQAAFDAALGSKDPQAMYLAAGKYERNGDTHKAKQIYERLIDRFPASQWAVKANDQLLQSQRVDAVNSSNRSAVSESRRQAYEACRIEMNSCFQRTNGQSSCYRDCDSLR